MSAFDAKADIRPSTLKSLFHCVRLARNRTFQALWRSLVPFEFVVSSAPFGEGLGAVGNFFAELRRRRIYRIGAAYVVVAWAIAQVIDLLSQTFALPDSIAQPVLVVLVIGFPVTLIVAWMIEGRAHEAIASAVRSPATTIDYALFGALAVVIGLIGYQQLSPNASEIVSTTEQDNAAAEIADDIVGQVADRLPNSIAVLPLENLSPDPNNAYFAAGIHDEILNKLSKLRNLTVIARASVMRYENSDIPIPDIAEELNVEMIMAGSVRYAGNQVLVTAELIDGLTSVPVWTDQYDGELSDIFGIQAEIAMNIANSLQAEFSVAEQENIERLPTDSPEAYSLFLQQSELRRIAGAGDNNARAVAQNLLDQALELDPEFALAYAAKADIFNFSKLFDPVTEEAWLGFKSEMDRLSITNADMALALDPSVGLAHMVRAYVNFDSWRVGPGLEELNQALRLSPNDIDVIRLATFVESLRPGRADAAMRSAERGVEIDPNNSQAHLELGISLQVAGRHAEASEAIRKCIALAPTRAGCRRMLVTTELAQGHNEAALDALRLTEQIAGLDAPNTTGWIGYGYGLLGRPEDAQRVFDAMNDLAANTYVDPGMWAWVYLGVRDFDGALAQLNRAVENVDLLKQTLMTGYLAQNIWFDPALERPDFIEVRNKLRFNQ